MYDAKKKKKKKTSKHVLDISLMMTARRSKHVADGIIIL
jgi:hypothetical protein